MTPVNDLLSNDKTSIDFCKIIWISEQNRLKTLSSDIFPHSEIKYICGVDISFIKGTNDSVVCTVVLDYHTMDVLCEEYLLETMKFPYISGFLAFREVSPIMSCYKNMLLKNPEYKPQVILVDGGGRLHPNKFGLACHLGVLLGVPTIGVAKKFIRVDGLSHNDMKKLTDMKKMKHIKYINVVATKKPTTENPLRLRNSVKCQARPSEADNYTFSVNHDNNDEAWGSVVTSTSSIPIYVSPGHMIDLEKSLEIIDNCMNFRIPEPVRQADLRGREWLRKNWDSSGASSKMIRENMSNERTE